MSQSDLSIANVSRSLFRQEANDALQALGSLSSGATEPTTTYAYQLWADTASGTLKQRNAANDGWINKGNLADVDWGLLNKAGGTMTGLLNLAAGTDIASATTVDLTAATGNVITITGTTAVEAFTMIVGQTMLLVAEGALPLTYNATTMNIVGGVSITATAGDRFLVFKDIDNVIRVCPLNPQTSGRLINRRIITASETGTAYTAGATKARVIVLGGGGGGGGSSTTDERTGGGGGAGGYAEKLFTITQATYNVTIGAAGAAGAGGGAGGTAGNTTFTDTTETLTGNGGVGGAIGSVPSVSLGGTATGGDLNIQGAPGGASGNSQFSSASGMGASSIFGGGGVSLYNSAPQASTGYGAGGGGGMRFSSTREGGIGRAGLCILEEYS